MRLQIKSPLLRSSTLPIYQHLYASTLARYRQPPEAECRPLTGATALYRDIRANMEQTPKPHGLDHRGRIITIPCNWFTAVRGPPSGSRSSGGHVPKPPLRRAAACRGPRIDHSSTRDSPPVSPSMVPEALSNSERVRLEKAPPPAGEGTGWLKMSQVNRSDGVLAPHRDLSINQTPDANFGGWDVTAPPLGVAHARRP
jgi:hypothetical protein